MPLKISIAMCTYNGVAHLPEQLDSLLAQHRLPNEIVIHDDGSSDGTWDLLKLYAARHPDLICIHRHDVNQGFSNNFVGCIAATSGDVIFPCDQDDIWLPEKLEAFEQVFLRETDVGLVFCDAALMNAQGQDLAQSWWQAQSFDRRAQEVLESERGGELMIRNPAWMAAGATMAFRASFKPVLFPIEPGWTHDTWIATRIAVASRVRLLHQQLNRYRQHTQQVYGVALTTAKKWDLARGRGRDPGHFVETRLRYEALQKRLHEPTAFPPRPDCLRSIEQKLTHWNNRARMRSVPRLYRFGLILRELATGRYFRASQGVRSLAMDLLL